MEEDFIYYIIKKPFDNASLKTGTLPIVMKIGKNLLRQNFSLTDKDEGEGPFNSKFELRRQSTIFNSIQLQKHKDKVLKNKNIKNIKDFIRTPKGKAYDKTFVGALHHTMVGKISKKKVKGVHFYNPDTIKIVEITETNDVGVYSAIIEKLNPNTGEWIRKEELTNFFPDDWTINQLFHECASAFSNRKHDSGNVYFSQTLSGIEVKFVINDDGKILTFYPIL